MSGVVAFSLFLLCISLTTGTVAAFEGGSGTEDDPYQIVNVEQLQAMEKDLDAHYVLVDDIDASETETWNDGKGFDPIGDEKYKFEGTFDGQGYEVKDLYIDRPDEEDVGLFGLIEGDALVEEIGVVDVNVTGDTNVGGLVGMNWDGDLSGSYATGDVTGSVYVGGLVGQNEGVLSGSYATGEVSGEEAVGGLIGWNIDSEVSDSYATGDVAGDTYVGGLIGSINSDSVVSNSFATGDVTGNSFVGGLVASNRGDVFNSYATGDVTGEEDFVGGLVASTNGVVSDSYATGSVTGSTWVGGLVGHNQRGNVSDSFATGDVTGDRYVGGLIGEIDEGEVSSSYWNIVTSGQENSDGGQGRTTEKMTWEYSDDTYRDWDFEKTWMDGEHELVEDHEGNTGYPALQWQEIDVEEYELTINIEGEGSADPAEGTHTYEEGDQVTVEVTPIDGWKFVEWTGDIESEDEEITVKMDGDKSVTAVFEKESTLPSDNNETGIDVEEYYDEFLPLGEGEGTPEIRINPIEGEGQKLGELINISGKGDGEVTVSGILVGSNELRSTPEGGLSTFGDDDEIKGNKFSVRGINGDFNMVMWDEKPEKIIFLVREEPEISYASRTGEENKIPFAVVYYEDLPKEHHEEDGDGFPWLWIGLGIVVVVIFVGIAYALKSGRRKERTGEESEFGRGKDSEVSYCPFCGAEIEFDSKFCPECGESLD